MNSDKATYLVMQVSFPLLVRGHSIQTRVLEDILSIRVPNLYRVTLGLPCSVLENSTMSYFDCKMRKLILVMPVRRVEELAPDLLDDVVEEAPKPREIKLERPTPQQEQRPANEDDDLLFDVV